MEASQPGESLSLAQLGHHVGLHVTVNLKGKIVGGVLQETEQWLAGVVVGMGALGDSVTIKLDAPLGGGERGGLLHHDSHGEDMVSIDDPARVRAGQPTGEQADAATDEVVQLVRAGKTIDAIKRYRELNGATLDEARAFIATL
jgi:hypothetical protein